jgi:Holliday junction DNA helicase RuvA
MIGWLKGEVLARTVDSELIVNVHDVGYRVTVPSQVLASVGVSGTSIELHVHTHVREDAIVLYGFTEAEGRRTFEALLGAHGVGPSLALAVMSTMTPYDLARAVDDDDIGALCTVPGVGRKTAARMLLDLKSKVSLSTFDFSGRAPGSAVQTGSARSEVRAALVELGYAPDEVRGAMSELGEEVTVEEGIRHALRSLAGSR